MTEYVTTCDGGVPLDKPVVSPPFFALIEPMEGRRDSATTGGPQGWRSREVDRHTLPALYAQVHGQQNTVRCDDCSAAGRDRPLVILCAPAAPRSPVVSDHPDTHRGRTERR